jgi:AcrR family transcriptional regulator
MDKGKSVAQGSGAAALIGEPGDSVGAEGSETIPADTAVRPMRADALENRRRILEAAEEVFAAHGVSAPIDDVAERAGVGVGTVYRHFSTKEDLFEAIVLTHLEELVVLAATQLDAPDPGDALFSFLGDLVVRAANKHCLIDALGDAGIDFKAHCAGTADELEKGVARMLQRAQATGAVRPDLSAHDVLGLVVGVCGAADGSTAEQASRQRMLEVVFAGLRAPVAP